MNFGRLVPDVADGHPLGAAARASLLPFILSNGGTHLCALCTHLVTFCSEEQCYASSFLN